MSQCAKLNHLTHLVVFPWDDSLRITWHTQCVISRTKNEWNNSVLDTDSLWSFLCVVYWIPIMIQFKIFTNKCLYLFHITISGTHIALRSSTTLSVPLYSVTFHVSRGSNQVWEKKKKDCRLIIIKGRSANMCRTGQGTCCALFKHNKPNI